MADTKAAVAHTPLPWRFMRTHGHSLNRWYVITDAQGRGPIFEVGGNDQSGQIAQAKYVITDPVEIEANAALIVRAVNSHQQLVDALREMIQLDRAHASDCNTQSNILARCDCYKGIAESAIRRAEGKEQEDGYADADTVRP